MKLKCPVAQCGWEGNVKKFYKHIRDYKEKMGERQWRGMKFADSHERWAQWYFKEIWNKNIPDEAKWVLVAKEYVIQERNRQKMMKMRRKSMSGSRTQPTDIKIENGMVIYDGKQYTPDEFSKIMSGVKIGR